MTQAAGFDRIDDEVEKLNKEKEKRSPIRF